MNKPFDYGVNYILHGDAYISLFNHTILIQINGNIIDNLTNYPDIQIEQN